MADADTTEKGLTAQLVNETFGSLMWRDITVTVKSRKSKDETEILSHVDGIVKAGEMLAVMGPS